MARTITLQASAKFGFGGKQYIARITGRNDKFTFDRSFVGTKSGKRRDCSEYMTDEPGLYVTCDIDSKGRKEETYLVIEEESPGNLVENTCTKEEAMKLAKLLDNGKKFADAVVEIWPAPSPADEIRGFIKEHKEKIATSEAKNDPDGTVDLTGDFGEWKKGQSVRRGDLIEYRKGLIVQLENELAAELAANTGTVVLSTTEIPF